MKIVALIPARKGSKGVPAKNWTPIGGKSLVERKLEMIRDCEFVSDTFVSTDYSAAHLICDPFRANIHWRSSTNSSDSATANDVVSEFISFLKPTSDDDIWIAYLQPTSPFLAVTHFAEAVKIAKTGIVKSVVSVQERDSSILKACLIGSNGLMQTIAGRDIATANRQSLPQVVEPNGALYLFQVDAFIRNTCIPLDDSYPMIMTKAESIDIDKFADWQAAEERIRNEQ